MFLVYYSKQPVATSCNVSKILCTYMYMFFKRAGLYALAADTLGIIRNVPQMYLLHYRYILGIPHLNFCRYYGMYPKYTSFIIGTF